MNPYENGPPDPLDPEDCAHERVRKVTQAVVMYECLDCGEYVVAREISPEAKLVAVTLAGGERRGPNEDEIAIFQGRELPIPRNEVTVKPETLSDVVGRVGVPAVTAAEYVRQFFEGAIPGGGKQYDAILEERLKGEYEQARIDWALTLDEPLRSYALRKAGDVPKGCRHPQGSLRYNQARRNQSDQDSLWLEMTCQECAEPLAALRVEIPPLRRPTCLACRNYHDPTVAGRAYCDPCFDAKFSRADDDVLSTGRRLRLVD